MTSAALEYLADAWEPAAPGLAVVLREWARVIPHDALAVAKESLWVLSGAQRLAAHVPGDGVHRDVAEVLEVVFLAAAREVFSRDARRRPS
jgi:hypothetical protein